MKKSQSIKRSSKRNKVSSISRYESQQEIKVSEFNTSHSHFKPKKQSEVKVRNSKGIQNERTSDSESHRGSKLKKSTIRQLKSGGQGEDTNSKKRFSKYVDVSPYVIT